MVCCLLDGILYLSADNLLYEPVIKQVGKTLGMDMQYKIKLWNLQQTNGTCTYLSSATASQHQNSKTTREGNQGL